MKFAFQSLASVSLFGLSVLLRANAAPVANELDLRTDAVLNLGPRADGLEEAGLMVERDEVEDAWHYAREEVPYDEIYARATEEDLDGVFARCARGVSMGKVGGLVPRSKFGDKKQKIKDRIQKSGERRQKISGGRQKIADDLLQSTKNAWGGLMGRELDEELLERSLDSVYEE